MKHLITTTALALALSAPTVVFATHAIADDTSNSMNSNAITSNKLMRADVRDEQGASIGSIEGVLLDNAGKTTGVIVDVGGFLGMGEHRVALNWSDLKVNGHGNKVVSRYSKDQLKALPEYTYTNERRRYTAFYDPNWYPPQVAWPAGQATSEDWHALSGNMNASKLIDARVRDEYGHDIGEVSDAVIDSAGQVKSVIVDVGGFIGIDSHRVSLDFTKLRLWQNGQDLRLLTSLSKDQLKGLPEYADMQAGYGDAAHSSGGGTTH